MLFMIDTCQANTMFSKFYSPSIIATGSSSIDQSSYSHHADSDVGVAVIDRYTYFNLEFLETQVRDQSSKKTLGDLFDSYDEEKVGSRPGVRYDLFPGGERAGRERLVMDFFGNVQNVEVDAGAEVGEGDDVVAAWREDLANLERMFAALRAENRSAGMRNEGVEAPLPHAVPPGAPTSKHPLPRNYIGPVKVEADEGYAKQGVGITVILGGLAAWYAASMLGSVK